MAAAIPRRSFWNWIGKYQTATGGIRHDDTGYSQKETDALDKRIEQKYDRLRKMYPEIRGKKVDFVKHWMEEGILFFAIRFMDGTNFCVQYEPTAKLMDRLLDMRTGNTVILKEYFRRRD